MFLKNTLKLFIVLASLTSILLIILATIISFVLSSESGRLGLLNKTTAFISTHSEYSIHLADAHSSTLNNWQIGEINIKHKGAQIVWVKNAQLNLSLPELLAGRVIINNISANAATFTYIASTEIKKKQEHKFAVPSVLPIEIKSFSVGKFTIEHPALPQNQIYAISGSLHYLSENPLPLLNFNIATMVGVPLKIAIESEHTANGKTQIHGILNEDKGGLIALIIKQPAENNLQGAFDITLALEKHQLDIEELSLVSNYRGYPVSLTASGNVTTNSLALNPSILKIGESALNVEGTIKKHKINFALDLNQFPLQIAEPWLPQAITGQMDAKITISGNVDAPNIAAAVDAKGTYMAQTFDLGLKGNSRFPEFNLDGLKIKMGEAEIAASGYLNSKNGDQLSVHSKDFPVKLLQLAGVFIPDDLSGDINADISVAGELKNPEISVDSNFSGAFAATNIKSALKFKGKLDAPEAKASIGLETNIIKQEQDKKSKMLINTDAVIEIKNQNLEANLKINEAGKESGKIAISVPWANILSLKDGKIDKAKLGGKLQADIDTEIMSRILGEHGQKVKGLLNADLRLEGTVADPQIYGSISAKNGYYENQLSGTVIDNIQAQIKANGKNIIIEKATATDGKKGAIELAGNCVFEERKLKNLTANAEVKNAHLLRRYDMDGIASGKARLSGNDKELNFKGNLDIEEFTLYLDTLIHEGVASVDVKEVYQNKTENKFKFNFFALFPPINLDAKLTAGNKIFVRGTGVDAELSGDIDLTGTALEPLYKGKFDIIRGKYEILGKSFKLTEDGTIQFIQNIVSLSIKGENKTKDADITATLTGTLDKLNIALTSDPVMPQDEIVSVLLFGKSSHNISPFQAISLANSIRKMKQGGPAIFDPLDYTKKLTGVDYLSLGSDSSDSSDSNNNGVSLGVGKYIGDKIYVEVEKGSSPTQPFKANIEAEITPHISVETSTSTGTTSTGGVELNWKRDY
jgi:translocation and assembly module TamB